MLHRVAVALGRHGYLVHHQEGRLDTGTELTSQIRIRVLRHRLKEVGGTRLGNHAQVIDEVGVGHCRRLYP